ncbi:MAG TPA: nitroreductase family deazaflavin-dependent oxidoreductase [Burkholderiales bacterium]|nr:nitroreductase family deazaflavin-dependent oxidoreductase [Burkholderiales bacterium]
MHIPRFMRQVNRVITNPLMGIVAGVLPPLAMVHHIGRKSGRAYRTPVVAFRSTAGFVIPMTYGRDVDWARNIVSAHGCKLEQMGRHFTLHNPRVVGFKTAESHLPGFVRGPLRTANFPGYVLLDLKPAKTGRARK